MSKIRVLLVDDELRARDALESKPKQRGGMKILKSGDWKHW